MKAVQLLGLLLCTIYANCSAELPATQSTPPIRPRRTVFTPKNLDGQAPGRYVVASEEKASFNKTSRVRPRLTLSAHTIIPFDPYAYRCSDPAVPRCANLTARFGAHVLDELRRNQRKAAAQAPSSDNVYGVEFTRNASQHARHPNCLLLDTKIQTLRPSDPALRDHRIASVLPGRRLMHDLLSGPELSVRGKRSCVIVSSAGALSRSNMGAFIDQHDIVMRFNHAPIAGHEADVGRKTTIRVVNSQVVTKPEFDFVRSPLFRNISIAAWDPGRFNGTLEDWLQRPDFDLFDNFMAYGRRSDNNNASFADAHLIDPRSVWQLWRALRDFSDDRVQGNPPSSGFIGLALLLPVCAYVDMLEYVPSTRLNGFCHYYDEDVNPACTFGSWHPLAAEKLMTYAMNTADAHTTFQRGYVRVRRPRRSEC